METILAFSNFQQITSIGCETFLGIRWSRIKPVDSRDAEKRLKVFPLGPATNCSLLLVLSLTACNCMTYYIDGESSFLREWFVPFE